VNVVTSGRRSRRHDLAKTDAERARKYLARKREQARQLGLCARCCKVRPERSHTICRSCHQRTNEYKRIKRQRVQETAVLQGVVHAHEMAGDEARRNRLYNDAGQHYYAAASIATITWNDYWRLVWKFNNVPGAMNGLQLAMPQNYRKSITSENAEDAIHALMAMTHNMASESKTEESLALCREIVRIATKYGTPRLRKKALLRLAACSIVLGRFDDAAQFLDNFGEPNDIDSSATRSKYYSKLGMIAANRGLVAEAYENLERSLDYARQKTRVTLLPAILNSYSVAAIALGDIERARNLCEQSLLITRRNRLTSSVPYVCLLYAKILAKLGNYTSARKYLLKAVTSDAYPPSIEVHIAGVGIPLALRLNDDETLRRCTRSSAITSAFRSGQPARIGAVASAFAQLYSVRGQHRQAEALLHRALELGKCSDGSFDLPLAIAQYGTQADVSRARILLEERGPLPFAKACLTLFDAFVTHRMYQQNGKQLAAQAAEQLDQLHWNAYGNLARSLTHPSQLISRKSRYESVPALGSSNLTERERQIVELVLQGRTNRSIAQQLSIREHTVEKHMSSIMRRLGIRSRHQLVNVTG